MNNDSYFAELEQKIAEMNELRKKCPVLATGMIGQSLLKEDLFFCASLNRSVQLSEGFITLLQQRNLSCVGAILRLLLDNCMRTYAAFIAKNKDDEYYLYPSVQVKSRRGQEATEGEFEYTVNGASLITVKKPCRLLKFEYGYKVLEKGHIQID